MDVVTQKNERALAGVGALGKATRGSLSNDDNGWLVGWRLPLCHSDAAKLTVAV